MGTDTSSTMKNLGKTASATPAVPPRPLPSGSSKLQRSTSPPTTRVRVSTGTKLPPSPNSAVFAVPNQTVPSPNNPHNTTTRVQGFFDMLAHGR